MHTYIYLKQRRGTKNARAAFIGQMFPRLQLPSEFSCGKSRTRNWRHRLYIHTITLQATQCSARISYASSHQAHPYSHTPSIEPREEDEARAARTCTEKKIIERTCGIFFCHDRPMTRPRGAKNEGNTACLARLRPRSAAGAHAPRQPSPRSGAHPRIYRGAQRRTPSLGAQALPGPITLSAHVSRANKCDV